MIPGLFAGGALLSLLGTRLSLLPLAAVAVVSAGFGGTTAVAGTWTAVLAAGLVVFGRPPRAQAVPLVGGGAVLLAGAVSNAALVLPAWFVGTAAAVLPVSGRPRGRRWGVAVLLADAPVVAAIVLTVLRDGFVGWPGTLDAVGAGLLLGGAALRAPFASGPERGPSEPGLLVVRAQMVVLAVLALPAAAPWEGVAAAGVVLGGLGMALGAVAPRDEMVDAVQEAGLAAIALGGSVLGWEPSGWVWGALAAGTLTHWSRVRVSAPGGRWAWVEGLVTRGGGLGAPFLAVAAAITGGAVVAGGFLGGCVVAGVVGGLGARHARARQRPGAGGTPASARALLLGMALVAAVWAPVLALPRPPAGAAVPWPPVWAVGLLAVGVLLGASSPRTLGPPRSRPGAGVPPEVRLPPRGLFVVSGQVRGLVPALLAGLLAAAAGVWVLGFVRGFL